MVTKLSLSAFSFGFILLGCRSLGSQIRYADIVLAPNNPLANCTISSLEDPTPGLRPFRNYQANPETIREGVTALEQDSRLAESYAWSQHFFTLEPPPTIEPSIGMLQEELRMVFVYTYRGDSVFNAALRRGGQEYLRWKQSIFTLISGLNKLSKKFAYAGELYRAEKVSDETFERLANLYKKDDIVAELGFVSTSKNPGNIVLEDLDQDYEREIKDITNGQGLIRYVISTSSGIDISPFSRFRDEEEVLLLPSTVLMVENVVRKGKLLKIYLTDLVPNP